MIDSLSLSFHSQRIQLNLPPLQAETRLKQDIKATKTVAMAVATYFICYVPAVAYTVWRRDAENFNKPWLSFLTAFCTFISSASNPIIYVLRNRKYRTAMRQLAKDPCGSGPFQERLAVRKGKDEKQRQKSPRGKVENLEGEAIRQLVAGPFGRSLLQERSFKTAETGEKQRQKDPGF